MNSRRTVLSLCLAVALAGCIDIEDDEPDPTPVARITVDPASGPAPLTVRVSGATSTATGGEIAGYAWDFGDESSGSGATVEHTYAPIGSYRITLTVTDDKGRSSATSTSVVATGPLAVYDASAFDATEFRDEPDSGLYDAAILQ